MKYLFIIFILISTQTNAQQITFDKEAREIIQALKDDNVQLILELMADSTDYSIFAEDFKSITKTELPLNAFEFNDRIKQMNDLEIDYFNHIKLNLVNLKVDLKNIDFQKVEIRPIDIAKNTKNELEQYLFREHKVYDVYIFFKEILTKKNYVIEFPHTTKFNESIFELNLQPIFESNSIEEYNRFYEIWVNSNK